MMLLPYNSKQLYLFITRGIPGCGKSTFVQKYLTKISNVIESDVIREKMNGRIFKDGRECINEANGDKVWKEIFKQLRDSLSQNQSTTIDATNINIWQLKEYKDLAKEYNAEPIIIDFSDISLEEAKIRNSLRIPEYKRVPNKVIKNMHKNLLRQNIKLESLKALHNHNEILNWLKNVI